MTPKDELVLDVPGEGKYYWSPILQTVSWHQPRARRSTIDIALYAANNNRRGALRVALRHATMWAKVDEV